ncbi:hypothetical protein BH10PSE16_BH10PSE16_43090 [soil metagenome]
MTDLTHLRKGKIVCPQCGDTATRVKRRLRDRLVSLIKPVKRYRCDFCNWTAALPLDDTKAS